MGAHVGSGSLALRVVLFFARNPQEELTTSDIVEKFSAPNGSQVRMLLNRHVLDEMLARTELGAGRSRQNVYKAGRKLLVMIGEERTTLVAQSCLPVMMGNIAFGGGI